MENAPAIIAILALLGGGLIFAEFFVPGGVLGILGALALAGMSIFVFVIYGPKLGAIALGSSALVGVLYLAAFLAFFQKSPLGKYMTLKHEIRAAGVPTASVSEWLGKRGEAVTPLRPSGKALIEGARIDVESEMGLISSGTAVEVVRVAGPRLFVRQVETA
jgi:membrane-bound serine protease (ClpP class)